MKRAGKKFWLCGSALALLLPVSAPEPQSKTATRANEVTLARLRPGRDTLETAAALYGGKQPISKSADDKTWTWMDACRRFALRVETDEEHVIQILTLTEQSGSPGCIEPAADPVRHRLWRTGRGLALGDTKARVLALYGAPNSTSPSVEGQRELQLLFYAFDWAGSDVPQVMEVTCGRADGRVVEITLAFPSL